MRTDRQRQTDAIERITTATLLGGKICWSIVDAAVVLIWRMWKRQQQQHLQQRHALRRLNYWCMDADVPYRYRCAIVTARRIRPRQCDEMRRGVIDRVTSTWVGWMTGSRLMRAGMRDTELVNRVGPIVNPFNASCSKLLLFEGYSAILV